MREHCREKQGAGGSGLAVMWDPCCGMLSGTGRGGKTMNFILGQIISFAVLIVSILLVQFKKRKWILLGEISVNLLTALSFVFLGGLSGAWICIAAVLQAAVLYFMDLNKLTRLQKVALMLCFMAVYVAGTIVVYKGPADFVSCACAILYVLGVMQKSEAKYRRFKATNMGLWILYDISVLAYVNIIMHGIVLISIVSAMIRLDRKK